MNEQKIKQLFEAARRAPSPAPPEDFAAEVHRAILRGRTGVPISFFDQLAGLFPRVAFVSLIVIASCVAGDFFLGTVAPPGLDEGVAQLADEWLMDGNEIGL